MQAQLTNKQVKTEIYQKRITKFEHYMGWAGFKARSENKHCVSTELRNAVYGLQSAITTARLDGVVAVFIERFINAQELCELLAEVSGFGVDQDAIARHLNAKQQKFLEILTERKLWHYPKSPSEISKLKLKSYKTK